MDVVYTDKIVLLLYFQFTVALNCTILGFSVASFYEIKEPIKLYGTLSCTVS